MAGEAEQQLRAYVDYLRDLGVYDLYRRGEPVFEANQVSTTAVVETIVARLEEPAVATSGPAESQAPVALPQRQVAVPPAPKREFSEPEIPKPISFDNLAPLPEVRVAVAQKPSALEAIREEIGDCTRCPLAYAGRRNIVFADGDPNARLMFVGEGPGADEDTQGLPFVGKAGQLLNNMISAMGLKREQVYIANIVKCRPPANRVPEPVEANTCSQFLLRQIDTVQPEVIVALGSTAATYLLGVKQSLSGLRGRWHGCRGAKLVVTYHPAFLLRDPRQKGEAWKDLQMVMKELGLKAPAKA
jgi:DNA polymerase